MLPKQSNEIGQNLVLSKNIQVNSYQLSRATLKLKTEEKKTQKNIWRKKERENFFS
jgi:hypothetical protein